MAACLRSVRFRPAAIAVVQAIEIRLASLPAS
eukprot:SAG31_NODE_41367_length_276_cov_0.875706_1_plen_31_part_01